MINLPELTVDSFDDFFVGQYGQRPFRWQSRLAAAACAGDWPNCIKLPTSSGKTSCIDIAVFALAHQAWKQHVDGGIVSAPRRIFFVVDRRIIVNEAFHRASKLSTRLGDVLAGNRTSDPLFAVAFWLRTLAGNQAAPPLDCFELRGGIYRDDAWVRSLLQPTVLTSTVDQVGSRLLFRGYGASDRNLPIHAALTANDSLILLDEAHCSKPFSQTMAAIARYRDAALEEGDSPRWAEERIATPFRFIEMTATPRSTAGTIFELKADDYATDCALEERHGCAKPVRLVSSKASGAKQNDLLAKELVKQAEELASGSESQPACTRIAIVVNRVACARKAYELLRDKHGDRVRLMIGRMRPLDRDQLTKELQATFRSGSDQALTEPQFVVATQCLEVGADFDFDAMVCQCASLDALRQRFGRMNRLGKSAHARGVVVMPSGDESPKKPDPIYGDSLPETWKWLLEHANDDVIDFGIRSLDQRLADEKAAGDDNLGRLAAPSVDAPVLMPAHLDLLCQTGPRPAIEPSVAAFLHGPQRGIPEVRVCWRADLPELTECNNDLESWAVDCERAITLCPPSSAECLSVPLPLFRDWLRGLAAADDSGDVLGEAYEAESPPNSISERVANSRQGVIWNAMGCQAVTGASQKSVGSIYPNATVVLPASAGGWKSLGHIPNEPHDPAESTGKADSHRADKPEHSSENDNDSRHLSLIDVASEAFFQSRARRILRVHPSLATATGMKKAIGSLLEFAANTNAVWSHDFLKFEQDDDAVAGDQPGNHADDHPNEAVLSDDGPLPRYASFVMETRLDFSDEEPRQLKGPVRYRDGFVIVGPRRPDRSELPRESFGDAHDEQNVDADDRVSLAKHLADVASETEKLATAINLPTTLRQAVVSAAERHDLGKADPRFQAMLLDSSIDMAWMQPRLWAKSARGVAGKSARSSSRSSSVSHGSGLPAGFRHEMLSLQLAEQLEDNLDATSRDVMLHAIAAHHGHARPFAPVVIDEQPRDVSLQRLELPDGGVLNVQLTVESRQAWTAHRLDSGVAERFWKLNRRFGWWGLAWLESSLRLADWTASATPVANAPLVSLRSAATIAPSDQRRHSIALPGLVGSNPLGFLAAIGVFRTVVTSFPDQLIEMTWHQDGHWHPVIISDKPLVKDELIEALHDSLKGRHQDSQFTAFGKNTTVPASEFRSVALEAVANANLADRTFADFCAGFGSDALVSPNDGVTIQDTSLRTMAGAGHQHFLETMRNLIQKCDAKHLEKSLFDTWQYDDPTQTLSLRFDPLDDNRYALRWRNPSGDPDRKTLGSMLGANRLAIEAIPLLPTAPGERKLQTACFTGHRSSDTFFEWPIWMVPVSLDVVRSLLLITESVKPETNAELLRSRGVVAVMRSQRITVGKVRNFTPARLKPCSSERRPVSDLR